MSGDRLLLDTHTFVWWAKGSEQLPVATIEAIRVAKDVAVSLVSLWEIVLKESTKNPMIGTDDAYRWFADAVAQTDFTTLGIEARHIGAVQHLPLHHRDPFDRLLVAQAQDERRNIVSRDGQLPAHDLVVSWWQ